MTLQNKDFEDGGIGGYAVSPHTTKRRTTTNLKTKNNQNCQKIKLYGKKSDNQGVKEETFIQNSRKGGDGQLGGENSRQGGDGWRTRQGGGWWSRQFHICMQTDQEKQMGSKTHCATQGSSVGR